MKRSAKNGRIQHKNRKLLSLCPIQVFYKKKERANHTIIQAQFKFIGRNHAIRYHKM